MAQTSLPHNGTAEDWDFKMATLFSIFESTPEHILHQALTNAHGDLEQAIPIVLSGQQSASNTTANSHHPFRPKKKQRLVQPRLAAFLSSPSSSSSQSSSPSSCSLPTTTLAPSLSSSSNLPSLNDRLRWKDSIDDSTRPRERIKPLVLYNPEDIAKHCPCTLIHNVLDRDLASRLLQVMLVESETWNRNRWWLFERIVESPHKTSYYTEDSHDLAEVSGWTYNGKKQDPPRKFLKEMDEAKLVVRKIVNELRSARELHPYEEQGEWKCNVAAVNHYAHSKESVGWHADKLTYLGPRPTIGSLTLGATRFFRIRKVVPDVKNPDTAGQMISIALPHNSLCIMWPPMQEEWKHEIPAQATVTPHPISGTARINITYRLSRPGFAPKDTPVCKCGVAMVLRCVFKNKANYGKYFYMCYAAGSQEGKTCGEFHWVDMEAKLGLVKLEEEGKDPSQDTIQDASSNSLKRRPSDILKDDDDPLDLASELLDDVSPIQAPEEGEAE
ncbi:MAG: hypothetical protein BYD32DRAFT_10997 [Podila humilis]|nr:MAG: hypothetical protein BYD32DRAFT_10997 [Podila humilis]